MSLLALEHSVFSCKVLWSLKYESNSFTKHHLMVFKVLCSQSNQEPWGKPFLLWIRSVGSFTCITQYKWEVSRLGLKPTLCWTETLELWVVGTLICSATRSETIKDIWEGWNSFLKKKNNSNFTLAKNNPETKVWSNTVPLLLSWIVVLTRASLVKFHGSAYQRCLRLPLSE